MPRSIIKFLNLIVVCMLLVSCNSTESVLAPMNSDSRSDIASGNLSTSAPVTENPAVTEAAQSSTRIHFLPITGAPANAITPLSRRLAIEAQNSGLVILPTKGAETQYTLKGYLSAFGDRKKTTIVYVWDILDAREQRQYRIQGQESVPGRSPDPWQTILPATMETIAVKTIQAFNNWQRGQAN